MTNFKKRTALATGMTEIGGFGRHGAPVMGLMMKVGLGNGGAKAGVFT